VQTWDNKQVDGYKNGQGLHALVGELTNARDDVRLMLQPSFLKRQERESVEHDEQDHCGEEKRQGALKAFGFINDEHDSAAPAKRHCTLWH
jgi:hypothetical protein